MKRGQRGALACLWAAAVIYASLVAWSLAGPGPMSRGTFAVSVAVAAVLVIAGVWQSRRRP